jgi:MerR family regulatory protein
MYTIGQVSEMFHLPVSTLRYYDKEGLFPNLKRESGIRKFNDHELERPPHDRMPQSLRPGNQRHQTIL